MDLISLRKLSLTTFFHLRKGSYTCICHAGFVGDGVSCMPEPEKPTDLKITVISSTEASVSWTAVDISKTKLIKVEYKRLGIHGEDWEVINLQPNETRATLRELTPHANYLVRVGMTVLLI